MADKVNTALKFPVLTLADEPVVYKGGSLHCQL